MVSLVFDEKNVLQYSSQRKKFGKVFVGNITKSNNSFFLHKNLNSKIWDIELGNLSDYDLVIEENELFEFKKEGFENSIRIPCDSNTENLKYTLEGTEKSLEFKTLIRIYNGKLGFVTHENNINLNGTNYNLPFFKVPKFKHFFEHNPLVNITSPFSLVLTNLYPVTEEVKIPTLEELIPYARMQAGYNDLGNTNYSNIIYKDSIDVKGLGIHIILILNKFNKFQVLLYNSKDITNKDTVLIQSLVGISPTEVLIFDTKVKALSFIQHYFLF